MKKTITLLFTIFMVSFIYAQQGINYKAIITNNGTVLQNQNVNVRFTILENGTTAVYEETHATTTDANGIIILNIGEGSVISGTFNTINWSNEQFLKTEIDTGSGYTSFGTTAFKAVPLSKNSDKLEGKSVADIKSELDTEKFNSILSRLDNLESQNTTLTNQVNTLQSKLDLIAVTQNVNLDNLESSVSNNTTNIAANTHDLNDADGRLQYFVNLLSNRITAVETKTADMSITNLTYNGIDYKTVRFSHVNVQIVNGTGATASSSQGLINGLGLGNLIIGYNEDNEFNPLSRTGYHNLIVGTSNEYTSYGGVVFGKANTLSSEYSTITGGYINEVTLPYSSISGGAYELTPSGGGSYYWIGGPYHSN